MTIDSNYDSDELMAAGNIETEGNTKGEKEGKNEPKGN